MSEIPVDASLCHVVALSLIERSLNNLYLLNLYEIDWFVFVHLGVIPFASSFSGLICSYGKRACVYAETEYYYNCEDLTQFTL